MSPADKVNNSYHLFFIVEQANRILAEDTGLVVYGKLPLMLTLPKVMPEERPRPMTSMTAAIIRLRL